MIASLTSAWEQRLRWIKALNQSARMVLVGTCCIIGSLVRGDGQTITNQNVVADQDDVDHAGIIKAWNSETLERGEKLYRTLCMPCHGTPQQQGSLPVSRAFWKEPFKNGNDPYSIYKTIGTGLG